MALISLRSPPLPSPLLIFSPSHEPPRLFSSAAAIPPSVIDIILGVGSSLFGYFSAGQCGLKEMGGLPCARPRGCALVRDRVRMRPCCHNGRR